MNSSDILCNHTKPSTRGKIALSSSTPRLASQLGRVDKEGKYPDTQYLFTTTGREALEVGCGRDQPFTKQGSFPRTHSSPTSPDFCTMWAEEKNSIFTLFVGQSRCALEILRGQEGESLILNHYLKESCPTRMAIGLL